MSYVVLARKYRPQTFEDVVGQNPVSQTLANAIESERIAHAYIFSGPRGVGKTTTARILAKCLNCEKGPTVNCCNKCESCLSIADGSSMEDVLEIDGASNRGIDQIRDLRENAKYRPSKSRYRIYIIDEAHQITKDGFGALLKTLEEPPAHVIFMMATTEVHKIPAPILSRCQRFALRPISPDSVFSHLKKICAAEKIPVEDDALKNIVRFVEGSLRDALSLLDQAIVFSQGKITSGALRDLLGLLPMELVQSMATTLKDGDPAAILKTITDAIKNGVDLTQLAKDLQNFYHTLLLVKAGVNDPLYSGDGKAAEIARTYQFSELERNIRLLARSVEDMRRSETPRAVFEVQALRIGQKVMDPRLLIERIEKFAGDTGGFSGGVKSAKESQAGTPVPSGRAQAMASIGFSSPAPAAPRLPMPPAPIQSKVERPAADPAPSEPDLDLEPAWDAVLSSFADEKPSLAGALKAGAPEFSGQTVIFTTGKRFHLQMIEKVRTEIENRLRDQAGAPVSIETRLIEEETPPEDESAEETGYTLPPAIAAPVRPEELQLEEIPADELSDDIKKAMKFFPGVPKRKPKE